MAKSGSRVWYSDQYTAREEVYRAEEYVTYAFQGTDPGSFDNQWLKEAMLHQVPLIYFFGVAPGRYDALFPTFVEEWSASNLSVRVAVGRMAGAGSVVAPADASDRRCAISGLPTPQLLDATHKMLALPLPVHATESMLGEVRDGAHYPAVMAARETLLSWRFYHHFATDARSPLRLTSVGFWSPVLDGDGGIHEFFLFSNHSTPPEFAVSRSWISSRVSCLPAPSAGFTGMNLME